MPMPIAAVLCSMLGCLFKTVSSADLPSEESGAASTLMPYKEPLAGLLVLVGYKAHSRMCCMRTCSTDCVTEPPVYHMAKAGAPGRPGCVSGSCPGVGACVARTWERAAFSDASWSTSRNCLSSSASSLSLLTLSCATC